MLIYILCVLHCKLDGHVVILQYYHTLTHVQKAKEMKKISALDSKVEALGINRVLKCNTVLGNILKGCVFHHQTTENME